MLLNIIIYFDLFNSIQFHTIMLFSFINGDSLQIRKEFLNLGGKCAKGQ